MMIEKLKGVISMITMISFVFSFAATGSGTTQVNTLDTAAEPQVQKDYGKTHLIFEENKGQTKTDAKFILRGKGYQLYLTESGAVYSLQVPSTDVNSNEPENSKKQRIKGKSEALKMSFVAANGNPAIKGIEEVVTKTNYYIGKKKFVGLSNYKKVSYQDLYNGIDAVFYGNQENQLEYDFALAPNADASNIKLNFEGAKDISISDSGDLVLKTENAEMVQQKPIAYQIINGERKEVKVNYNLVENQISFELGEYDKSQTLTIDPVLNYLSYIGGTNIEFAENVTVDAAGNAFIVGTTNSLDYPVPGSRTGSDFAVFVSKLSADGSTILYNTFLDGSDDDGANELSGLFSGSDIAVDASGNAHIAGRTTSEDFPISNNAYQRTLRCERQFIRCIISDEVFVTKLNATGTIVYSTFLGGKQFEDATGIVVDSSGKAYVTGITSSGLGFPKKNEYQGTGFLSSVDDNAFLTVFNASGSDIVYSTGLGGNEDDLSHSIAIDAANNVYITGSTSSTNGTFPTKNAFQASSGGGTDAFVAKFNPTLSGEASLIYSTLLGGAGTDRGNGITVNSSNQAHVVGVTGSPNFPLANAIRSTNQINEAFVSVIGSGGNTLVNSTFLGGADQETATSVALDSSGNIYVTGNTQSNNFPLALPFQATLAGEGDAFVTKLKFGKGILSSSYLGGSDLDSGKGIAVRGNKTFVVGLTKSNDLATTAGVIKPTFGGSKDGFVAKILDTRLDSVGVFRPNSTFVLTQSITNVVAQNATFTGGLAGANGVSGDWDGDGIDSIGSFTNGTWKVRNSNFPLVNLPVQFGFATFSFGLAGDLPVVGDWDGDGIDTAGTFRPGTGEFFLTNSTTASAVNNTQQFGIAGDLPVAGDWDGDGIDTVGVFRPSTSEFFLTNSTAAAPTIDIGAVFGLNGDLPLAGDFNGDGLDTIGVFRPSTTEFFITDDNAIPVAQFQFGLASAQPIVGDWDGRPLP